MVLDITTKFGPLLNATTQWPRQLLAVNRCCWARAILDSGQAAFCRMSGRNSRLIVYDQRANKNWRFREVAMLWFFRSSTVLSRGVRSLFGPTRKSSPWGNFSDGGSFVVGPLDWSIDWLIDDKLTLTWLVYWIRTARSVFTGAQFDWIFDFRIPSPRNFCKEIGKIDFSESLTAIFLNLQWCQ